MTSQEVRALIDAKIKGQGTNVDAGSVLPAILNGILDLIDSGGGGGTSDAVQYIPQILTSPQQMQARKNQGLYYSEGGGEDVTLTWDGSSPTIDQQGVWYKVSTAYPSLDLLKTIKVNNSGVEQIYNVASQEIITFDAGYSVLDYDGVYDMPLCIVISAESYSDPESGLTFSQGIWFTTNGANIYTSQLVYGQTETIHHIEPKYIKDMYYEESGTGEKTVESVATESPTPAFFYDYIGFYKAASDTPAIADIKKVNNITIEDGDLTAENEGDYTIYTPDGATETQGKFIVVYENTTIDSHDAEPGLYYPSDGIMFARPYLTSVTYIGDISIVHQIPAKYIPDMPSGGLEYYEIELVDWTPLQLVSAELVGYTWGDIVNALYAGKLLVFTIKDRNASDGQVSVKIIGGQLSKMTDIEGSEYGMPCVRFPAAYSYLRQGSAGQFNSTTVKDIVIYPDWTQGGDEPVVMVGTEDSFTNQ